jgi:hypothetical protein
MTIAEAILASLRAVKSSNCGGRDCEGLDEQVELLAERGGYGLTFGEQR